VARKGLRWADNGGDPRANPRLLRRAIPVAVGVNPALYERCRFRGEGGGALGLSSGSGRG
jgi:hypothetical protein